MYTFQAMCSFLLRYDN